MINLVKAHFLIKPYTAVWEHKDAGTGSTGVVVVWFVERCACMAGSLYSLISYTSTPLDAFKGKQPIVAEDLAHPLSCHSGCSISAKAH